MLGAEMGWLVGVGVALLLESPLPNPHCVGRSVEEVGRGRGPEDPSTVPAQQFFSPGPFLPATASPSLAPTPPTSAFHIATPDSESDLGQVPSAL